MKKFITIILLFCFLISPAFCATPVDFIYINGSNNNDEHFHKWFLNGINKLHPTLKSKIEKNEFTYKHLLNDGEYEITPKPIDYFWGFKSSEDLMTMKESASQLRSISPIIAYFVRNTIASIMHDAIWVYKQHNMLPILQELDEKVRESINKGHKVVLLGYSAGTFITLEYLLAKLPYINVDNWVVEQKLDKDVTDYVLNTPKKDTCVMAFAASGLTTITAMGRILPNRDKEEFIEAYKNIDSYSSKYCTPEDGVIGVINYASPIPLFYSDLTDSRMDSVKMTRRAFKYIIEHDFFFLTTNFADDPLGFPNGVNYKNDDVQEVIGLKFDNPKGFMYDYSSTLSFRTFAFAHTSYWSANKRFSNAIVKAYKEGYNFQYGDDTTSKSKKNKSKKSSKTEK